MEVLTLERTLTELDHVRVLNLVRRDARGGAFRAQRRAVEDALDASAIVPSRQVPPDVVTMYSQVLLQDLATGERTSLTLCYPADADPAAGRVSVLSPAGGSLLGSWFSAEGGQIPEGEPGMHIPDEASPSRGSAIDDVPARVTPGEFIVPKDTVQWVGEKHLQKLIQKSREEKAQAQARPRVQAVPLEEPTVVSPGARGSSPPPLLPPPGPPQQRQAALPMMSHGGIVPRHAIDIAA